MCILQNNFYGINVQQRKIEPTVRKVVPHPNCIIIFSLLVYIQICYILFRSLCLVACENLFVKIIIFFRRCFAIFRYRIYVFASPFSFYWHIICCSFRIVTSYCIVWHFVLYKHSTCTAYHGSRHSNF